MRSDFSARARKLIQSEVALNQCSEVIRGQALLGNVAGHMVLIALVDIAAIG